MALSSCHLTRKHVHGATFNKRLTSVLIYWYDNPTVCKTKKISNALQQRRSSYNRQGYRSVKTELQLHCNITNIS